jgi:hypothetical protein
MIAGFIIVGWGFVCFVVFTLGAIAAEGDRYMKGE